MPQPVYINLVREPVSRAVSSYYYARVGDHGNKQHVRARLGEQADWSINKCIEEKETCQWMVRAQSQLRLETNFFCGHNPICATDDQEALQLAKYNLLHNYAVVGITERFAESVKLLQRCLPAFFGPSSLQTSGNKRNVNRQSGEIVNSHSEQVLGGMAKLDRDLYKFAVEVFDRRLKACGLA